MFMFVPSFLICDSPGVLGLDNLLCYLLEAMGEVPAPPDSSRLPLRRPDASLGTISTSFRSHTRKREAAAGTISPRLPHPPVPRPSPASAPDSPPRPHPGGDPSAACRSSAGPRGPRACHTEGSRRAGQDDADGIPRARPHRFLEGFCSQAVSTQSERGRRASPLRHHTTRDRRQPRDAVRLKAIGLGNGR
jgi:hypothetical protein